MLHKVRCSFLVLVIAVVASLPDSAAAGWQKIDASTPFTENGKLHTPACSGGPVPGPSGPAVSDTTFSFFFRPGNPKKLAIFWDGGGSCWDANTCVGSALTGAPLYTLGVDETTSGLDALDGLGDFANPENPIADYTQVFIPYCTGDLHTGARDTVYLYGLPDGSTLPWLIHHRGADNVAAVRRWLLNYYQQQLRTAPSKVFLAGASAGGYGVLYSYPSVAAALPATASVRVLVDAANGIINQDFYNRALVPGGAWGIWNNMSPQLAGAFSGGPEHIVVEVIKALGASYPKTRIGQYTTAFDATQIGFYNIARHVDDPSLWFDPLQLGVAALDWTLRARLDMLSTAFQHWNYRYYLASGTDHTIVPSDKYYLEQSAGGVAFVDFVDDMINRLLPWGSDWRNASCTPNCLP